MEARNQLSPWKGLILAVTVSLVGALPASGSEIAAAAPPMAALVAQAQQAAPPSQEAKSYYQIIINRTRRWKGVAGLARRQGAVEGELCLVPEDDLGRRPDQALPLRLPVRGTLTPEGALTLATSENFPEAGEPLTVTLKRTEMSSRNHIGLDTEFWRDPGRRVDSSDAMYMMHLPSQRPGPPRFTHPEFQGHTDSQMDLGDGVIRDLAVYDGLSIEEGVVYQAEHRTVMTPVAGAVAIVIEPERAPALVELLASLGDGARLRHPELAGCGAPFLGLEVEVPPGAEFWYARRLQRTGLVLTAYPIGEEMGPNWVSVVIIDAAIASTYANRTVTMDHKDKVLAARLQRALAGFALARRPNYRDGGSITRRLNGVKNIFVFELVGRALSTCAQKRWERLLVQFVLQPSLSGRQGVEVSIQIPETFFAPGEARPPDERLDDNRLSDDQLQRLQDMLASYLLSSGFKGGSTDVPPPAAAVKC